MSLFAADRAKAIKTKAVVNESPTEKLIRELREENQRLLDQLKMSGGGQPIMQGEPGQPQMVGISEEGSLILIKKINEGTVFLNVQWSPSLRWRLPNLHCRFGLVSLI